MNRVSSVRDCSLLQRCESDLRSCSLDDHDESCPCYMFDDGDVRAFDFDSVMSEYCSEFCLDHSQKNIKARSVDALYVGQDLQNWDNSIALIEFKNGNLLERTPAALGSKQRNMLERELTQAIDTVLMGFGLLGFGLLPKGNYVYERRIEGLSGFA